MNLWLELPKLLIEPLLPGDRSKWSIQICIESYCGFLQPVEGWPPCCVGHFPMRFLDPQVEPGAGSGWAHSPAPRTGVSGSHPIAQTPKKTGNPTPWLPGAPWSKCGDPPSCPETPAWRSSRCPRPLAVFSDFLPPRFSGGLPGWDNRRPGTQAFVSQSLVASAGHPTTLPTPTLNWTIAQVLFRSTL